MDFSKGGQAFTAVSACQRGESSSPVSGSSDATALHPYGVTKLCQSLVTPSCIQPVSLF